MHSKKLLIGFLLNGYKYIYPFSKKIEKFGDYMQVIVNKLEIEKSGNRILQLSEEYNDKIKEIRNIISIIENNWVGDDAVAYKEMIIEKCIPNLEKIKQMIDQYGTYLKRVPEVYYAIDSICLNKGNGGQ